ncbi:MAG: hypothetical protein AB1847_04575 [bacterium]
MDYHSSSLWKSRSLDGQLVLLTFITLLAFDLLPSYPITQYFLSLLSEVKGFIISQPQDSAITFASLKGAKLIRISRYDRGSLTDYPMVFVSSEQSEGFYNFSST